MARMTPSYYPTSAPPGESALYEALATERTTDSWIVLHSLALAEHVRQVEGEADFVVFVPDLGMLVIEVKSHRSIQCDENGLWILGADHPTRRSPFQQAREAMFSIRAHLKKRDQYFDKIPMTYAVWFTHIRARTMLPLSAEWHEWQVLDEDSLRYGAVKAITHTLTAANDVLREKYPTFGSGIDLSRAFLERAADSLRPRFEVHLVPADIKRQRQEQLTTFVEEQFDALDAMADNQAVLFTGPAGSGKTLLASEAAHREASQGRSGKLLCFNRLLSKHLASDLEHVPGVTVRTLHQELLHITGLNPPSGADTNFWERDLPEYAVEVLRGHNDPADFIIIDEIQDLAHTPYVDVLDLMVKGGLNEGRILLFGDFGKQAIYLHGDGRKLLRSRCPQLVVHRLLENCRNLPRIGLTVNIFSKLDPGFHRFRRTDDGVDPEILTYTVGEDQSYHLIKTVHKLRQEGLGLDEIVVLSPLAEGSTAETTSDQWLRQVLYPVNGVRSHAGRLRYTTIQAFKGLEAPAVIVTDLNRAAVPNFEALLYVGLTRGTDRLTAIIESTTLRSLLEGSI